jgi:hypothetical protein
MGTRTTDNEGYEHPTGVADAPTVAMYRDGLTVTAATLAEAVAAIEAHPCAGITTSIGGERTATGWDVCAAFSERRAGVRGMVRATCWQGHEVPLVDGVGRCHCGEDITVIGRWSDGR